MGYNIEIEGEYIQVYLVKGVDDYDAHVYSVHLTYKGALLEGCQQIIGTLFEYQWDQETDDEIESVRLSLNKERITQKELQSRFDTLVDIGESCGIFISVETKTLQP